MTNGATLYANKSEQYLQRLQDSGINLEATQRDDLLKAMGMSDFLAETLIRSPQLIENLFDTPSVPQDIHAFYSGKLTEIVSASEDESQLMSRLRTFRNQQMALITWRDVMDSQTIEDSLNQVSVLADQLIVQAYNWVYQHFCERYGAPQGDYGPQPLYILGMGKLGGGELNFSSDIDLIFTYPASGEISGPRKSIEHHQFFTKVAQKLITVLHHTTAEGQVFRVDMRLRPFGDSGPLVTPFSALEDYYQDQGREWERYAMIKARILNPDEGYSTQLKNILKPFVFRRYLDFGAIDSLRKMKQLISQEVRRRGLANNIKLGAGGIREVEFIVQSFQLIRGGREPDLQQPSLLQNLAKLEETGALPKGEVEQIKTSYLFLRKAEHCLQQINDQQTQTLPEGELDQHRLCTYMGFADYSSFMKALTLHREKVHAQFVILIGDEEEQKQSPFPQQYQGLQDVWQLNLTESEAAQSVKSWIHENEVENFVTAITQFKGSLSKRGVGQKGLDTLHGLIPLLLKEIVDSHDSTPSLVLTRCLAVFSAIMGRTTYLQLLNENQGALAQLVKLCAASPWITDQVRSFPILLDELINPAQLYHPTPVTEYQSELRQVMLRIDPHDLELQMETLRQFKLSQQLKIAAADVTGALPIMKVSDHLTFLAEALVKEVVSLAWQQISEKHGEPEGTNIENKGFAVIGYGKMGGIELGYGSDLDLVFIHNAQPRSQTNGDKQIESARFYTKLAQRIMHLFNTKTASGQLYEIDMRLRPSGNAGLLVCHVNGFQHYQFQEAWTWEHQAIVRARLIYAEPALVESFTELRKDVLSLKRAPDTLRDDVAKMREKMRDHLSKGTSEAFDLKQDKGGIADIEFLVQYWVLANAHTLPELNVWSDNVRILGALHEREIITQQTANQLIEAYLHYRNVSHRLALQQKEVLEKADEFEGFRENVIKIWHQVFGEQPEVKSDD